MAVLRYEGQSANRGLGMNGPTLFEWLTMAAIVAGPILALSIQRLIDALREKKERRVRLFLTLMSTRATQLAPDHINALNSIDVVFSGRHDRRARDAWHEVLTHLTGDTTQPDWQERLNDLKVDLYREIGARVGYTFTTDYLKRAVYRPKYYGDMEQDILRLRRTLLNVLTDDGLKIRIAPAAEEPKP
jgi:Family of unknown function (DUF6680)